MSWNIHIGGVIFVSHRPRSVYATWNDRFGVFNNFSKCYLKKYIFQEFHVSNSNSKKVIFFSLPETRATTSLLSRKVKVCEERGWLPLLLPWSFLWLMKHVKIFLLYGSQACILLLPKYPLIIKLPKSKLIWKFQNLRQVLVSI